MCVMVFLKCFHLGVLLGEDHALVKNGLGLLGNNLLEFGDDLVEQHGLDDFIQISFLTAAEIIVEVISVVNAVAVWDDVDIVGIGKFLLNLLAIEPVYYCKLG